MESGERLASPSSAPSSLHRASSSAGASPAPAPAPPHTPSDKCGLAPIPSSGSPITTCGDQHFNMSGISSAFPLVSHPAFGLFSANSGRSEFGGLGTLGVSAALASHPQLSVFPDWWRASEAHGHPAAALFPPLLGLPPMFAPPFQSHNMAHFHLPAPSKNGRATAKGTKKAVNSGSISSSSAGNCAGQQAPIHAKKSVEKTSDNNGSRGHRSGQPQVQKQASQKANEKKLLESSSVSGSQSGSSSDSSSDGESSSDLDDPEEGEDDLDEDDDPSNSDDSDSEDGTIKGSLKPPAQGLTSGSAENKRKRSSDGDEARDKKRFLGQRERDGTLRPSSYLSQSASLSTAGLFHSPRTREDEATQHTSVIQATGSAATNKPLAMVTHSHRETSSIPPWSPPKPLSLGSSPMHFSFPSSSSPKRVPPSTSPKHPTYSSSPKYTSSSPVPLSLCASPKPLSLSSSPKPCSSPKPPTQAQNSPTHKSRTATPGSISALNESSLHAFKVQPFLPQDSFKQAFSPPKLQDSSKSLKQAPTFSSPSLLPLVKPSRETPGSQALPPSHGNHANLFLSRQTNGVVHDAMRDVQDAPLALITKPRSHSTRAPSNRHLSPAAGPPFSLPVNLSTGAKAASASSSAAPTASTSCGPANRSRKSTAPKPLHAGKSFTKSNLSLPVDAVVKSTESDIPSSKDSDDSLGDDEEDDENDEDDDEDSDGSLSESDSNLESDSDGTEGSLKARGGTGTETEAEKTPPKLNKALFSLYNSSSSSSSLSASFAPLNLQVIKPHGPHSGLATPLTAHSAGALTYRGSSPTFLTPPGPGKRRRVTDEQVLRVPLQFGWQRETRIRTVAGRLQGEVAYYAPCGKKLRQYPDVMKYLSRNGITEISRDNFSFSTKIKVGDFYEVREGPKGFQWFLLKEEEIGPCIIAMDGRRSRHSRSEQQQSADSSGSMCKEGHPPNFSDNSVQDVNGVKLLRKLEAQEIARQAAQIKLMRKLERQAMVRAAKEARRQQAIMAAEERRKKKEEMKMQKQQEKMKRIQHIRMEKELRAQQILEAKRKKREEAANAKTLEAEKRSKEKELRRRQAVLLKHQELERHRLDMEKERRRQHLMLMKAMEARKKTEERERLKQEKRDEKRLNKERKLELKRLELEIAKELKKPNEDMCLADHKNLPELSRIPGLVLSGNAFSDCLMVMQFLHSFGKVLGLDVRAHVPNLSVLQEGLLNVGNSMGQVQGLLVCMLSAAVCDPGLPPGHRTKTALGDHLTHVNINADNVSEILQMYMEAQCEQTELAVLAHSLKTKAFQAHTPAQKASILAFLVNELCCSKAVVSEIDKTIDYMTNLRKDKWIVEGKLRKLRSVHAKRTGRREGTLGSEDGHTGLAAGRKHRRKDGDSEEDEDEDDDSEDQGDDDDEDEEEGRGGGVGRKGKKAELCDEEDDGDQTASVEELEKQIEKLSKQQSQIRRKLFDSSHSLRSTPYGQDRHKRRYWHLLQCGGILVEGMESGEGSEELEKERQRRISTRVLKVKEEQQVKEESSPAHSTEQDTPESLQDSDSLNLFLQKPGSFSKLSKLLEVANISPDSDDGSQIGQNSQLVQNSPAASATIPHAAVSCSPFTTAPQLGAVVKPDAVAPSLFSVPCLGGGQPILPGEQLLRALTERSGHWFSLLPRSPCDESSVTSSPSPQASSASPPSSSSTSRARSPPSLSPNPPPSAGHADPAGTNNLQLSALQQVKSGMQQMGLPFCSWPSREPFSPLPPLLALAYQHSEGGSNPFLAHGVPAKRSQTPESHADKPLGTPSPTTETTKNQDYPDPQPIPEEMTRGWWRVSDMEQLEALLKALHSRGVREKGLQKQLQKHMEYMAQACTKSKDVMGSAAQEEQWQVSLHAVESWSVEEQAMEVDIGLLQQVEALERKVTSASLQVKSWMHPDPQSEREDLVYYEHKPPSSLDLEGEGEASQETRPGCVVRRPDNPLDIAVGKLAELERSIERSGEEEGAPGMRLWRKALGEVRSSAQLSLCIQQLQKTIAWERSIMKAYCQLCRKGDNEELLLLCDGCDKGCHTYCHRPKITTIPDGDWFCPACMAQGKKQQSQAAGGTRDAEPKPNKRWSAAGELSEDEAASPTSTSASSTSGSTGSGSNGSSPRKGPKETKKRKGEESPPGHQPTQDSPAACGKKAKTAKDNTTKDLAICRVLLADLETQQDAWPFLIPVNHKAVPGYKKVIKRPMDFSTIREKLITNQYLNLETFIIDVNLVFDNCEKFNEDNSEIGRAGHSMRRFFDRRWTELLKQTF